MENVVFFDWMNVEWKLWKEKRNVEVYQVVDSRPDAPLLMGRGKIDVSVDTMKNLIIEVSNWKQWDPLFDSGKKSKLNGMFFFF